MPGPVGLALHAMASWVADPCNQSYRLLNFGAGRSSKDQAAAVSCRRMDPARRQLSHPHRGGSLKYLHTIVLFVVPLSTTSQKKIARKTVLHRV